jgi:protein TonB
MKAIGGVLLVHAALAVLMLSGLNTKSVTHTVDQLKTFDIRLPPLPPPPRQVSERARDRAGAPSRKASPTPVVAPPPKIALPSPLTTAPVRSTGSAATAGGGTAGDGTGAGGLGSGPGGGGAGDYSGYTPARMLNKIPDHEYRRIANGRIPWGSAGIRFRVNPDGTMTNCRIVRSSGDRTVDLILCDAATRYLRFSPARNRDGRAIAQDISYTPTWRPNY